MSAQNEAVKIQSLHLTRLKNFEHHQYHVDFAKLVIEANPSRLGIKPLFDVHVIALEREDDLLQKITKSEYTEKIKAADKARDTAYLNIKNIVRTGLKHHNPEVVNSAKKLTTLLEASKNANQMTYRGETSAIYNLLQEFRGRYAGDVELLRIIELVDELERANKETEALLDTREDERAQQNHDKMIELRANTDAAYNAVVERINALVVVEGAENYALFVTKLNGLIDQYKIMLARNKTHKSAEPEPEPKAEAEENKD